MKKIPRFILRPEPTTDEARSLPGFKWAEPEIGHRHQLGGDPTFLQEATLPDCPNCQKAMTFYGQFDSINDDVCIADCGLIFVFLCFDRFEATSFVQSN